MAKGTVYRKAALRVEQGRSYYSCLAIKAALGRRTNRVAYWNVPAVAKYADVFSTLGDDAATHDKCDELLVEIEGIYDDDEMRDLRVTLLCMMAAVVERP